MFCEMSGSFDSLCERVLLTDAFIFDDDCVAIML